MPMKPGVAMKKMKAVMREHERGETKADEKRESPRFEKLERMLGAEKHGAGDKLTAKARKALPDSAFALPKKRAFPIQDKAHAAAAKSRAAQFASPAEKAQIDRKANLKLYGSAKGKK